MAGPKRDEHIVSERDKYSISRTIPLSPEDIGPASGPPFPVLPGVRLINRLAGGPARLAEFGDVFKRNAQRIAVREGVFSLNVSHHALSHFWHAPDVVECMDVFRFDPGRIIKGAVKARSLICPGKNLLDLAKLKLP